jgi:hypothetical protein
MRNCIDFRGWRGVGQSGLVHFVFIGALSCDTEAIARRPKLTLQQLISAKIGLFT